MPTYQYTCTECGNPLEVVQSFSDDSLTECPECGGRLRKVFSPVGVVFKGSGFYRNDSRSSGDGKTKTASSDNSGDSKSATSEKTSSTPSGTSNGGTGDSGTSTTTSSSSSSSKTAAPTT